MVGGEGILAAHGGIGRVGRIEPAEEGVQRVAADALIDALRLCLGLGQRRKEQATSDGNDRDHDQRLSQGETSAPQPAMQMLLH